jgi:exonuclease VII small subunit
MSLEKTLVLFGQGMSLVKTLVQTLVGQLSVVIGKKKEKKEGE